MEDLMESLQLSEAQNKYFQDLFLCCCDKVDGEVSLEKATELFRSASLHPDIILQVLRIAQVADVSENQQSNPPTHISRRQFYSCLKLISACQAGSPPSQETLQEDMSSPMTLPRFFWGSANDANFSNGSAAIATVAAATDDHHHHSSGTDFIAGAVPKNGQSTNVHRSGDLIVLSQGIAGDAAIANSTRPHASANHASTSEQPSTDSEVEQNDDSSAIENSDNRHSAWSTGSESPTPTNSVAVKGGTKAANLWHGLICEEQRQLLGTEEESSDRHSSDDDPNADAKVPPSSHNNYSSSNFPEAQQLDESVYEITQDQRVYYTKQWRHSVAKDVTGKVSGPVARTFFEKSRVPVDELRHVWKMCDTNRDGTLTEAEFMAAMHLVVLRRNHIPLPPRLPKCLHANVILNSHKTPTAPVFSAPVTTLQEADLLHLNDEVDEIPQQQQQPPLDGEAVDNSLDCGPESINSVIEERPGMQSSSQPHYTVRAMPPPPIHTMHQTISVDKTESSVQPIPNSAWTKFNESPTTTTSNLSSPGPKPVHFDIQWTVQAVGADPQIFHPVALRLTPQGAEAVPTNGASVGPTKESCPSPTKVLQQQQTTTGTLEFRPIQRPQAKKMQQVPGVGAIPPPPVRDSQNMMNMSMDSAVLSSIRGNTDLSSSPEDDNSNGSGAGGAGGPQPPIPPPRLPMTRHTRSSSLDLNKLLQSNAVASTAASLLPEVPPRDPQLHSIQTQHSCDAKLDSTFADFSQFTAEEQQKQKRHTQGHDTEPQTNKTGALYKPSIPSKRTSAFEVYRKPVPQQPSPVTLDHDKKMAHLEDLLRGLNMGTLNKGGCAEAGGTSGGTLANENVVQQLKDQNAVLVNMCLEMGNELFSLKYKREEMAHRLLVQQQVDEEQDIGTSGVVSSSVVGTGGSVAPVHEGAVSSRSAADGTV